MVNDKQNGTIWKFTNLSKYNKGKMGQTGALMIQIEDGLNLNTLAQLGKAKQMKKCGNVHKWYGDTFLQAEFGESIETF